MRSNVRVHKYFSLLTSGVYHVFSNSDSHYASLCPVTMDVWHDTVYVHPPKDLRMCKTCEKHARKLNGANNERD